MKMVKHQKIALDNGSFEDVYEGDWNFDESKPYEMVTDPAHDYDYNFDEAAAVERMYEASFHRTNPIE
ncbi:hypothetical protein [Paenibacillus pinihumi]|uniref:hypothetical protein n=1 Tax=Paenibacillus pinihumi TaxID=669462 RepID=UPI0004289911|nr:hypothetical protein [Paenibacillus pinihumi]